MDLNLGLCNVMLPLTPRTSVKVIAANINSVCDILRRRSSLCRPQRDAYLSVYFFCFCHINVALRPEMTHLLDQFKIQKKIIRSFPDSFLFGPNFSRLSVSDEFPF